MPLRDLLKRGIAGAGRFLAHRVCYKEGQGIMEVLELPMC